jgi:beta-hydroxylase
MKTAFFSILAPGTHVPAHRGPYKGLLRCHLGLKVPQPELCRLRVHDQILHWQEGQCMVFDDTYEHEVWNDSHEDRVVLFLDIMRPMAPLWSASNQLLIGAVSLSPLVQEGLARFRELEEREYGRTLET